MENFKFKKIVKFSEQSKNRRKGGAREKQLYNLYILLIFIFIHLQNMNKQIFFQNVLCLLIPPIFGKKNLDPRLNREKLTNFEISPLTLKDCNIQATTDSEQGEIFIVPHLLLHGASLFSVLSEGMPNMLRHPHIKGIYSG